jgi:hypothetical protein
MVARRFVLADFRHTSDGWGIFAFLGRGSMYDMPRALATQPRSANSFVALPTFSVDIGYRRMRPMRCGRGRPGSSRLCRIAASRWGAAEHPETARGVDRIGMEAELKALQRHAFGIVEPESG